MSDDRAEVPAAAEPAERQGSAARRSEQSGTVSDGTVSDDRAGGARHRSGLASRISAVTIAAVLLAGIIAALLGIGLVRSAARSQAARALAHQADVAEQLIDREDAATPGAGAGRTIVTVLRAQGVPTARMSASGAVSGDPKAVAAVDARIRSDLLSGRPVSTRVAVDGHDTLVEGRPLTGGAAIVLTKAVTDAVGPTTRLLDRQMLALAIGVVVASIAAVLLARALAGPLRRVAEVSGQLAVGRRDVRVPVGGPAELARVGESLNALAGALAVSEEREREFLLSVTHELRTPLTAVKGFAEAIADGVATGPGAREAGSVILAESARLEHLIADLLDLARLRAQEFSIHPVPVDLAAVLAGAAQVWETRCGAEGVVFHADLPPSPVTIVTDAARVRQVVDGLMENALRVTPAGRAIELSMRPGPGGVALAVADSGPGLTADDRAVAFQRSVLFERYRGVRPVGTGLGLALVQALTVRLGGTATVDVSPAGGALFVIHLPAGDPAVRFP